MWIRATRTGGSATEYINRFKIVRLREHDKYTIVYLEDGQVVSCEERISHFLGFKPTTDSQN